ncbi:MAG: trypsin-like peptidase domain-containing protein [Acutalibacteraceae bacterium]|nr:trypsin-like peptidase domain-containing protein [Acutalibacteraceae bacterium]
MQDFNSNNYNGSGEYYNYTPPKKSKKYGASVVIISCILSAVIGAASAASVFMFLGNNNTESNLQQPILQGNNVNINVDEEATSVVEAVATKVTPSVIGIRTTTSVASFFGNQQSSGEGSGVVYKQDGYIITNYHVISDAIGNSSSKIEVFLDNDKDAESYEASVVGYNISSDLAVVKINATGLTPIEIADSSDLKVGQYVITVGNPGGLEFMDSVTYGVISGLNRIMSSDSEIPLIQTDAAINPGNSGGALVNTSGKLVGINSAKIVSEEFEGMGFAIPSNTVVEICNKIIEKENSPEPYIGVTLSEKYTAQMLMLYGYPKGAVILTVADGSPAYQTGIRKGDIITEFNGTVVEDYKQFNELFEKVKPGEEITVKIYRNGKYYSAKLKIGSNNSVQ